LLVVPVTHIPSTENIDLSLRIVGMPPCTPWMISW
jgi:hypothetical protein